MVRYEIVIIGGGPAGLAAAVAAKAAGAKKIVILERDERLGGILSLDVPLTMMGSMYVTNTRS